MHAFVSVRGSVSERCVSDFPRLALYLCMKNDQNRSTSLLYHRSKHVDDRGWLRRSPPPQEKKKKIKRRKRKKKMDMSEIIIKKEIWHNVCACVSIYFWFN